MAFAAPVTVEILTLSIDAKALVFPTPAAAENREPAPGPMLLTTLKALLESKVIWPPTVVESSEVVAPMVIGPGSLPVTLMVAAPVAVKSEILISKPSG